MGICSALEFDCFTVRVFRSNLLGQLLVIIVFISRQSLLNQKTADAVLMQ